jgi:ATP-dependent helicase/nuclease subunit A
MNGQRTQWTQKQLETIELREKNILVSAAAGSGKTAVLVERIKQLMLKDKVPVDRILVVTFTKAAASEMKEKLVRALRRAVGENPNQAEFLRIQLDLIPRANISTFHSFALDVIRRYYHLISLDPGFKVCDEAESKIMKADAMSAVFEDFFEEGDPDFLSYVRCYGNAKSETELKKSLIGLYERIRSIPDSFSWLSQAVAQLDQTAEDFSDSNVMSFINRHVQEKLSSAAASMEGALDLLEEYGIENAANLCRTELQSILEIRDSSIRGTHHETKQLIESFKPGTLTAPKSQQEEYAQIKEHVKSLRDRAKDIVRKELQPKFFAAELSEYLEDIHLTHGHGKTLNRLLLSFHEKFSVMKREKSLLDFNDIEHFAIEILRNPEAAGEYRDKFQFIFIDEYQDSNLLQETIIAMIQRHNNVFMVGDIKQSIYKFRLAEPEIFQQKYALFKHPETLDSTKIDLNRNFRSKESIIAAVNGVFSNLMDYDADAALYRGIPDTGFPDIPVDLVIVNGSAGDAEEAVSSDENIEDMKAVELEAAAAAQIVKEALGTTIFDVKANVQRPLQKKDIVILMHGVKRKAEIFQQALQDMTIDSYIDDHSGYFDTLEIMNFSDLLKVVDNDKRDLPLLGVLRSPVFSFTIDELIEIRNQSRSSTFHGAFRQYALHGPDETLRTKIVSAQSRIKAWRSESRYLPLEEFVWKLMAESGFYTYVGALQGGALRQANLRIFVERAKTFRLTGDGSIFGMLRYISAIAEKEVETGQASIVGENDDIVRIMTIHKSKGLEFPFVLLASMGSRFIFDKMDKTGVMHKDLGLGLTLHNPSEHWFRHTLIQQGIIAKKRKEELEEAVRVLYVAFTRAMDKLVLLGGVSDWEKDQLKYESSAKAETNYLGMVYPHAESAGIRVKVIDRGQLQQNLRSKKLHDDTAVRYLKEALEHGGENANGNVDEDVTQNVIQQSEAENPTRQKRRDLIRKRLSYEYPNEDAKKKKSKYSVSELNQTHTQEFSIEKPGFLSEKTGVTPVEAGNIMHIVMEHIDLKQFHRPDYLETYIKSLVGQELLLPEEAAFVDRDAVLGLAESELGRRMSNADTLHREQPFNLLYPYDGVEVMVQGVVDCWFEENGEIILVDYKTGKDRPGMEQTYREQLRLYKTALETIMKKPVKESYLYLLAEGRALKLELD